MPGAGSRRNRLVPGAAEGREVGCLALGWVLVRVGGPGGNVGARSEASSRRRVGTRWATALGAAPELPPPRDGDTSVPTTATSAAESGEAAAK